MCNINIEKESHFLCECPCYQDYRTILLNYHAISAATPQLDMFYLYMSSNVTALPYLWEGRNTTMYHVYSTWLFYRYHIIMSMFFFK